MSTPGGGGTGHLTSLRMLKVEAILRGNGDIEWFCFRIAVLFCPPPKPRDACLLVSVGSHDREASVERDSENLEVEG